MSAKLKELTFSVSKLDEERLNRLQAAGYGDLTREELLKVLLVQGLEVSEENQADKQEKKL